MSVVYSKTSDSGNRLLYKVHFQIIGFPMASLNLREEDNLSTRDTTADFILSLICLCLEGLL